MTARIDWRNNAWGVRAALRLSAASALRSVRFWLGSMIGMIAGGSARGGVTAHAVFAFGARNTVRALPTACQWPRLTGPACSQTPGAVSLGPHCLHRHARFNYESLSICRTQARWGQPRSAPLCDVCRSGGLLGSGVSPGHRADAPC